MKTEKFSVTGMTCAACQANVARRVQKIEGISNVEVSLLANQMSVQYDEAQTDARKIEAAVAEIGYGAASLEGGATAAGDSFRSQWQGRQQQADESRQAMKRRLISSIALLVPLMYVAMGHMLGLPVPSFFVGPENAMVFSLTQFLLTVPILIINGAFFTRGFKALVKGAPNMDSLVAIGSAAALVYGLFSMFQMAWGLGHADWALVEQYIHALYFESAAMILTLVTVGKFLEARSKSKTSDALGKLVDLAPKTAVVLRNGAEQTIPAEQVVAGDILIIRPGESIPVDGLVTEGRGYVDQSAITGESIPVEKNVGDTVISATINKNGSFRFQASKVGGDTTLAQIIRLVDEAGNSKAPIARLADRISGIFVPVVIGIALLTAIVWLAVGQRFEFALSNAIAVLVISCPCALGLATPVAIMVGTGKAAEQGILIKSAAALENLHEVDTIVLDKTGTITSGKPAVTDLLLLDGSMSESAFLAAAAGVEAGSEHPLAQAILEKAKAEGLAPPTVSDFSATAGRGVSAIVDGKSWLAGNRAFLEEMAVALSPDAVDSMEKLASKGRTPLLFARDGALVGIIAVADTVRESSRTALKRFQEMGLNVVMLTGDNKVTAEAIRKELGIQEAIADVLPTEKEAHIRALQAQGHKVAMVGDGINDAPALTRADIGIAIGAGTDIAIESADVVLMKDSLNDAATAIRLSRAVIRNIRMNLFWAFFYNVLGIPVAAGVLFPAFGLRLSPMLGAAAMSLSSVCVVANALRLRFFKDKTAEAALNTTNPAQATRLPAEAEKEKDMKKIIAVEGMMCAHCQAHVQKALEALEGVQAVQVSLEKKQAAVTLGHDVADQVLTEAISAAGYTPGSVQSL